jgi:outer membrane protein OmpA-like peptidoglycan-associated protein
MAKCWRCFLVAFVLALLLGLLVLPISKSRIDDDLAAQARESLTRNGIDDVDATSDWATITLRGPAAASAGALAAAERMPNRSAVDDVRYIAADGVGSPEPATEPDVTATIVEPGTPSRVRLTGSVPSQADRDALVDAARAAYGANAVDDQLTVTGGSTSASAVVPRLAEVISTLAPEVTTATARLDAGGLTVSGTARAADAAERANAAVAKVAQADPALQVRGTIGPPAPAAGPDAGTLQADLTAAVQARGIVFATNSSRLTPGANRTLDRVATLLAAAPTTAVLVSGYTDDQGVPTANVALSQRRAEAVRAALIQRGISATRLTAVGRGSASPVASNATEAGRTLNRRITFTVQKG